MSYMFNLENQEMQIRGFTQFFFFFFFPEKPHMYEIIPWEAVQ